MRFRFGAIVVAVSVLGISAASAQSGIGEMADIRGEVKGAIRGAVAPLKNGSSVVQNQTVSTATASTARVAFHDLTSLSMGPSSSVTLDRYVYNNEGTISGSSLQLARGAFRLVSGRSPSQNIGVKTPTATIGLRGTVVDVLVRPGREIVWLRAGVVTVCKGRQCVPLDQPGQGVYITAGGVSEASTAPQADFDFDQITQRRFPLWLPYGNNPRGEPSGGSSNSSSSSSTSGN